MLHLESDQVKQTPEACKSLCWEKGPLTGNTVFQSPTMKRIDDKTIAFICSTQLINTHIVMMPDWIRTDWLCNRRRNFCKVEWTASNSSLLKYQDWRIQLHWPWNNIGVIASVGRTASQPKLDAPVESTSVGKGWKKTKQLGEDLQKLLTTEDPETPAEILWQDETTLE